MSDLVAEPRFTSVVFTWNPPQELHGVIIAYEVTYRTGNQGLITTNTTDFSTTFSTPELLPGTNVSGISVRAYTGVGPGDVLVHPFVVTPIEPLPRK